MYMKLSKSKFKQAFSRSKTFSCYFSSSALDIIYDYYEKLEFESGVFVEFDMIEICRRFNEEGGVLLGHSDTTTVYESYEIC